MLPSYKNLIISINMYLSLKFFFKFRGFLCNFVDCFLGFIFILSEFTELKLG